MKGEELLYRLREIMPEIGVNPVADEMYNIVDAAVGGGVITPDIVHCRECLFHRELDRTNPEEDEYIEGCVWCRLLGVGESEYGFCYKAKRIEKERKNNENHD